MSKSVNQLMKEHQDLCHAMQSGVEFSKNKHDQLPKHLRVGINVALRDLGSLVKLLIDTGVIDEVDYWNAMVEGMRVEVREYEQLIREETGGAAEIKLI